MPNTKARSLLSLTTKLRDVSYYTPGGRAAGPLAIFTILENANPHVGMLSCFQMVNGVKRFCRQDGLAPVLSEDLVADAGGLAAQTGTTVNHSLQPGSVRVTTEDDSGFSGTGEGAGLKYYIDDGNGLLVNSVGTKRGTVNYNTGAVALLFPAVVTDNKKVRVAYAQGVPFVEGVKLIKLDGFESQHPIHFQGVCDNGTMQGWMDIVGQWL